MTDKDLLGACAALVGIIGFFPYYWSLLKRQTKPHLFSWIPWTTTSAVAFAGQLVGGGGAGAWATGASAFFFSGDHDCRPLQWRKKYL